MLLNRYYKNNILLLVKSNSTYKLLKYISIYRQALDTDVRREVLMQYETAYKTIQQPTEALQENWKWNQSVSWMAMNNLQQQQVPSTALVGN